jgi:hypothetical protein
VGVGEGGLPAAPPTILQPCRRVRQWQWQGGFTAAAVGQGLLQSSAAAAGLLPPGHHLCLYCCKILACTISAHMRHVGGGRCSRWLPGGLCHRVCASASLACMQSCCLGAAVVGRLLVEAAAAGNDAAVGWGPAGSSRQSDAAGRLLHGSCTGTQQHTVAHTLWLASCGKGGVLWQLLQALQACTCWVRHRHAMSHKVPGDPV